MTKTQIKAIKELHDAGYAVIIWTPDELDGVKPETVEESSISHGWDIIEMNK